MSRRLLLVFVYGPSHGIDQGVGDLIVIDWFGPLLIIGGAVGFAAALHVGWRRLRPRPS